MHDFEKLIVYQKSLNTVDYIYEITKRFPKEELFLLTNQLRRAAVSVALNIAEGSGRSKKEFVHFLNMARTSAYECVAIMEISKRQKYIQEKDFIHINNELSVIIKMINKLKTSISANC